MLKAEIRKKIAEQRRNLTQWQFEDINSDLLSGFKSLDFSKVRVLHIFLPIVKNKEPNTLLMIDWLAEHHPEITVVVSRSNFDTHLMTNHPYLGKSDLKENAYHIPEPQTEQIFEGKIDMVLVPLLAFDEKGYRVGYGKGFYDRFLANSSALKVGISIFEPVETIYDVHADDIKLDLCICPKQIYKFVV